MSKVKPTMTDAGLVERIHQIKREKPPEPVAENCFDFSLGDSGYGVRCIIAYQREQWGISTSIGWLTQDDYTPMPLSDWTLQLHQNAYLCVEEILECFNPVQESKTVQQTDTIVLFRFKEAH